jgi:ketosteroid isomerase-like protein
MDTREVVERYYATVNAGDWETWLTVFDEHVVVDEQLAGHLEGVGAMRQEADAIRATYPKFRMDPEHVVVQGQEACAIWLHGRQHQRSAGRCPGNQLLPRRRGPHRLPGQLP